MRCLLYTSIFAQEPSGEAAPPPAEQTDQDEDTNQLLQQFEKAPTLEGGTQKLYHIRNVNIHGAQYIDNSILRASSGLIPGDSIYLPSNFISTAITRLWNQRLFSDVYKRQAFAIVLSTFLAYLMVPIAQHYLRPTVISMYNYVQPVASVLFTVVLGLDVFGFTKAAAAGCIFQMCIRDRPHGALSASLGTLAPGAGRLLPSPNPLLERSLALARPLRHAGLGSFRAPLDGRLPVDDPHGRLARKHLPRHRTAALADDLPERQRAHLRLRPPMPASVQGFRADTPGKIEL